jgi:hypothetical protein
MEVDETEAKTPGSVSRRTRSTTRTEIPDCEEVSPPPMVTPVNKLVFEREDTPKEDVRKDS